MKNRIFTAMIASMLFSCAAMTATAGNLCDGDWPPCPDFVLKGKLQDIFAVSDCKFISGISCKITYNGKLPLPSEVFFTEFDAKGRVLGKKTRLIYPHLNPGERGTATFRTRTGEPAQIVLMGVWNGPWKNPY